MQNNSQAGGGWIMPALSGIVLGSALQLQQPTLWPSPIYLVLCLMALALVSLASARRVGEGWRASATMFAAAALAFGGCGLRSGYFLSQGLAPALEGRDVAVTGMVGAMPQRSETALRFRLEVESARLAGEPVALPPELYLSWYGGPAAGSIAGLEQRRETPELRAGERWQITVRLKAPHGGLNPHGFDYELWLWEQGLHATGYVRDGPKDPPPTRIAQTWQHPVERARQSVREAIYLQVADRKAAGLLAALIVGDQNAIDRVDWDIFRATGVAHLMSISGLHVTMFAWAAALVVGWLWRRSTRMCLAFPAPHAALLGGAAVATAYALFSGWGVPSQRTVLMLTTVSLLRLSGRRWPWVAVWLLACAAVVTVDPWALMQAGFWLSFVAVGVLFAADPGGASPGRKGPAARLMAVWHEQWIVTLALAPLTLLLFGQVSVVGLAANLLAIPWVTLVVTPLGMAGVLLPPLWNVAAWALSALQVYLEWLAAMPFATFSTATPPLWAAAVGVAGGVLLAMNLPRGLRLLGLPLLVPVLLWQAPRPAADEYELLAADIGQGNAVVVRTAAHTLVYDSGPRYSSESDAGHRVLVPLLRALDERVDTLVLSHRDSDHTGGAAAVLTMQPNATLLSSIEDDHELQSLRRATRCEAGQHWRWDGVDFDVLHPLAADYESASRKPNALSCVLRVSNGRQTAMLVGDIEQPQEAALLAREAPVRADVLLVPHHGSKTSSSPAFLNAVQPSLALVQAGYRNRFGHPAEPVMARYRQRQVRVLDSPHCGAVWWRSADPAGVECQRETAARYWHHRTP